MPSFSIPLSGLNVNYSRLQNAGNNIANANTPGFRSRSVLQETGPRGDQVRISSTAVSLAQGGLQQTENPLDLAIDGDGFFSVKLTDGSTAFTRTGQFTSNKNNQLSDQSGNTLLPPITIPPGATGISVDDSGEIFANINGNSQSLGKLSITTFPSPQGLQSIGNNLLKPTDASGIASVGSSGTGNRGQVLSGYIETSNVDLGEQFVELLDAKNGAVFNLKTLKAQNETTKSLLDIFV